MASRKPDCSAIGSFKGDIEGLLIWSEERRIWLLNISNGFLMPLMKPGERVNFLAAQLSYEKKRHDTSQPFPDKRATLACHPSPSSFVYRAESLLQLIRDLKLIMRIAISGVTKSLGLILLNTKATLH